MPGVGTFDFAVEQLHKLDLFKTIRLTVLEKKIPLLGICLGAQLMTKTSHEGKKNGLNLVDYETVAFNRLKMSITDKIPHMGWEYLQIKNNTKLFNNFDQSPRFYFLHSYHFLCVGENQTTATANYGYQFPVAFEHENLYGVQFHPEKSGNFGIKLMNNFVNI